MLHVVKHVTCGITRYMWYNMLHVV